MNKIHDEDDSEEEDEEEGIDIDLEDDGIETVKDDNNWILNQNNTDNHII